MAARDIFSTPASPVKTQEEAPPKLSKPVVPSYVVGIDKYSRAYDTKGHTVLCKGDPAYQLVWFDRMRSWTRIIETVFPDVGAEAAKGSPPAKLQTLMQYLEQLNREVFIPALNEKATQSLIDELYGEIT